MIDNVYHNAEGYYDQTAGDAITSCNRKARSDRRKAIRKANTRARKMAAAKAKENQEGGACE